MTVSLLKQLVFFMTSLASLPAIGMTQCPSETLAGKPELAWLLLLLSVLVASLVAYLLLKQWFNKGGTLNKVVCLIFSLAIWVVVVYLGILMWMYFMFSCF